VPHPQHPSFLVLQEYGLSAERPGRRAKGNLQRAAYGLIEVRVDCGREPDSVYIAMIYIGRMRLMTKKGVSAEDGFPTAAQGMQRAPCSNSALRDGAYGVLWLLCCARFEAVAANDQWGDGVRTGNAGTGAHAAEFGVEDSSLSPCGVGMLHLP
jgi:hypothetical protein